MSTSFCSLSACTLEGPLRTGYGWLAVHVFALAALQGPLAPRPGLEVLHRELLVTGCDRDCWQQSYLGFLLVLWRL
jgi:hypothetical protein